MKLHLLACAGLAAVAASSAQARDHSAYFGIEAGPMWLQDSHFQVERQGVGSDVFTIEHKLGIDGDLIAGYDLGFVRAEVEGAYKWAKHDEYSDDFGSTDADGHSRAYSLMGNVLFDLGKDEAVNFYAGGGVGIAWLRQRISVEGNSNGTILKDSGFAWQGIAGVRAPVFRHFDIGLKYRYFDGGRIKDDQGTGGVLIQRSRFRSHSVLASLIYNFNEIAAPPPPPPPPPPPAAPPPTQTCPDGSVILATDTCPAPPPAPPPPPPAPERG